MSRDSGSPKSVTKAPAPAAAVAAGAGEAAGDAPFRGFTRSVRAAAKRAAAAVAACAAKESEEEREDREGAREAGSSSPKQKRGTEQGRNAGGGGEGHEAHRQQRRQEAEPDSECTGFMVTVTVRASGLQRKKQCSGGSSPSSSHNRPAKRAKAGSGLEAAAEDPMREQQQQQQEEPAGGAGGAKAAKGASAHQGRGSAASAAAVTAVVAAPGEAPPPADGGDTSAGQGRGTAKPREQQREQQRHREQGQEEQGEQEQREADQAQHGQQQGRMGNGFGPCSGTTANVEACGTAAAPTGATGQLPGDDSGRQGQGQGQAQGQGLGCSTGPGSQAGKEDGAGAGGGCMAGSPREARAASAAAGAAPGASTAEATGLGTAAADAAPAWSPAPEPEADASAAAPASASDAGGRGPALPSACELQDGGSPGASQPPPYDTEGLDTQHVSPSGAAAARISSTSFGHHRADAAASAGFSPKPGAACTVSRTLSAASSLPLGWTPFAIQRAAPAGGPSHGSEPAHWHTATLSGNASPCAYSTAAAASRGAMERAARSSGGGASSPAIKQEGGASPDTRQQHAAPQPPPQQQQQQPLGAGPVARQHGTEEGLVPGNMVAAAAAAAAVSWMERCKGGSGELARVPSDALRLQRGCGSPQRVTATRGSHGGAGLPPWQELSGGLSSPQGSLTVAAVGTGNTPSRLGPSHQLHTEGSSPRALSAQQPTARVLLPTQSPAGSPLKACGPPPITTGFAPSRTAGRSGSGGSGAPPLGMAPLPPGPAALAGPLLSVPVADAGGPPPVALSRTQATPFNCPAAAAALTAGGVYGSAGDAAAAAPPLPSEPSGLRPGPLRAEAAAGGPVGRSDVSPRDCNSSTSCSSWQQGLEPGVRAGRGVSGGGGRDARTGSETGPAASPLCTSVPAAVAAVAVAAAGAGASAHAELQRMGSPASHPEPQIAGGRHAQQAGPAGPCVQAQSVSAAASGPVALQTHTSVPQAPTSDITGSCYTQYTQSQPHRELQQQQQQQQTRGPAGADSSAYSSAAGAPCPPSAQAPSSAVPMPPSGVPPTPLRRYPRWMPYPYPYSPASPHGTPPHPYPSAWAPPGYGYPYPHSPHGYGQSSSPSAAPAGPQPSDDSPNAAAAAAGPHAWAPYASPYVPYRRRYLSAPSSQPYQQGTPWSPYYNRYHPGAAADTADAVPGQHPTTHGSPGPASRTEGALTGPRGEGSYAQGQPQLPHQHPQTLPTVGSLPTQVIHASRLGPGGAPGSNGAVGSNGAGGALRQDDRTGRLGPAAPSPYAASGPYAREASPSAGVSPYSAGPNAFGARADGPRAGYGLAQVGTPGGSAARPTAACEPYASARGATGGGPMVGVYGSQQLVQRPFPDVQAPVNGVVPGTEWLAPFAQSPAAGAAATAQQQQHRHHHYRQQCVSEQGVGAFDEGALDALLGMCPAEELFGSGEGGDAGIFGP